MRGGELPALVAEQDGDDVVLRWNITDDLAFNMPTPVRIDSSIERIEFNDNMARLADTQLADIQIDPNMDILRQLPSLPTCEEQRAEEAEAEAQ